MRLISGKYLNEAKRGSNKFPEMVQFGRDFRNLSDVKHIKSVLEQMLTSKNLLFALPLQDPPGKLNTFLRSCEESPLVGNLIS